MYILPVHHVHTLHMQKASKQRLGMMKDMSLCAGYSANVCVSPSGGIKRDSDHLLLLYHT